MFLVPRFGFFGDPLQLLRVVLICRRSLSRLVPVGSSAAAHLPGVRVRPAAIVPGCVSPFRACLIGCRLSDLQTVRGCPPSAYTFRRISPPWHLLQDLRRISSRCRFGFSVGDPLRVVPLPLASSSRRSLLRPFFFCGLSVFSRFGYSPFPFTANSAFQLQV